MPDSPATPENADFLALQQQLEATIPEEWPRARLQVLMIYEKDSVGTSHILSPPDQPDDFVDLTGDLFQITARIERTARFAGQAWREMTVDAERGASGWVFDVQFVNKAA